MPSTPMIEAEGLRKRYGPTQALAGVDLSVAAGSILGVLGPNGAGKTTAVRILTTLAVPDAGRARVAGHDVVVEAAAVRRQIGVTAQDATLDELLTGRQNLVMVGELSGLRRPDAKARAGELLGALRPHRRRRPGHEGVLGRYAPRLDLAAGLVTRPPVLFLDEPTTGLDPTSRLRMWEVIRELVADGRDPAPHDPVPGGGGRARRPHRGHRPRHRDRGRDVGRVESSDRWRPTDRHPVAPHPVAGAALEPYVEGLST